MPLATRVARQEPACGTAENGELIAPVAYIAAPRRFDSRGATNDLGAAAGQASVRPTGVSAEAGPPATEIERLVGEGVARAG